MIDWKDDWLRQWGFTPGTEESEKAWAQKLALMERTNKAHMIMTDIQPYQSMVTGEYITSRSQHRAHLKQHNLIEIGNEVQKPKEKKLPDGLKETVARQVYERLKY